MKKRIRVGGHFAVRRQPARSIVFSAALICMLAMSFALTGCGNGTTGGGGGGGRIPSELVGRWGYSGGVPAYFEIRADGSGSILNLSESVTWTVSGGRLSFATQYSGQNASARYSLTSDGRLSFSDAQGPFQMMFLTYITAQQQLGPFVKL